MKTIDFSHFIERYIAGEMSEEERAWFERELLGNESLRSEVELRRKTEMVLKNQDVVSLRNKLSQIEKRRREAEVPAAKSKRPVYIRYAAIITALIVIGSIALHKGKSPASDELISRYYKPYDPPASQRSGKVGINADFTLALEFYNTNDYENAARFFSKVVESNPKDMQSVLLNGVSNFEDKKYPEAKISFATVIDDNNNLFIETASWYLALCYIKTGENDKAISQLKKIKDEGGMYSKDARKILRKLE
jgi:tetratricopeptide (TPR) repeat protein